MIKAVIFDYGGVINRRLRLQHPILDLADQLHTMGYKTAILSNMAPPIARLVRGKPHLKYFDLSIFSCDIGVRKPYRQAYEILLLDLGLRPEECLFIDNRKDNIHAASNMGMKVIRDRNTKQTVSDIQEVLSL